MYVCIHMCVYIDIYIYIYIYIHTTTIYRGWVAGIVIQLQTRSSTVKPIGRHVRRKHCRANAVCSDIFLGPPILYGSKSMSCTVFFGRCNGHLPKASYFWFWPIPISMSDIFSGVLTVFKEKTMVKQSFEGHSAFWHTHILLLLYGYPMSSDRGNYRWCD